MRPEAMPRTLIPHLTVWVMYLILGGLLYLQLRRAPDLPLNRAATEPACDLRRTAGVYWLVFPLTSALATQAKPIASAVVLFSLLAGISAGAWLVLRSAFALARTLSRRRFAL
ncbi:MAG: hypothetical protein ACP5RN_14345 [Armatimonadota bacterium]